jgi:hypothetical protein
MANGGVGGGRQTPYAPALARLPRHEKKTGNGAILARSAWHAQPIV